MSLIGRFFSERYVNSKAVGQNFLLLCMYRFAYPFSFIFNLFGITPNQLTFTSIVFAMLSAFSIVLYGNEFYFLIFWSLSLLLDFCDGTVARMSKNISKTALRVDHASDLFKIFIVILAVAIHYNSLHVWISSTTALFSFMYYMVLNHELSGAKKLFKQEGIEVADIMVISKQGEQKKVKKHIKSKLLKKVLLNIYAVTITINGHTLLIFLLLPFSESSAIGGFVYLGLVSTFNVYQRIISLTKIPRYNQNSNNNN